MTFPVLKIIRFLLTEDKESTRKFLNHINVCAVLHNFLLVKKNEGTESLYEEDGCASDTDDDNELSRPIGAAQINDARRRQLTQCFAEKNCN